MERRENMRVGVPSTGRSMTSLMPSLLKYFTIVGGILFAGLIGLNTLLEPGGPGPRLVKDMPKVVVRVDPQASKVERLRAEEAALKAAEKANPEAHPVVVTEPLRLPPLPVPEPAAPMTEQAAQSTPAALNAQSEPEAARVRTAQEETRQKVAAEKARKKRIARERARTRAMQEASAARQQDEIYYGYAARPSYGPFRQAQGGFGGGWGGGGGWGSSW
jgi:hypothetical protein